MKLDIINYDYEIAWYCLTPLVLRQEYSRQTRATPWLLMPWLLVPPGHQQCYRIALIGDGFQLPVPFQSNVNKLLKMQIYFCIFPQNNWAGKGLTHSGLVIPDSVIDRTWSTLVQVMAWCLTAPSHYLNQCWFLTSEVLWHSHEGFFSEKKSRYLSLTWVFKITILRLQLHLPRANEWRLYVCIGYRADSRFAPSQCETSSQSNAVSHWLGTNLESTLIGDSDALRLLLNLL